MVADELAQRYEGAKFFTVVREPLTGLEVLSISKSCNLIIVNFHYPWSNAEGCKRLCYRYSGDNEKSNHFMKSLKVTNWSFPLKNMSTI